MIKDNFLFDKKDVDKLQALDRAVDKIRAKYGTRAIIRGSFANGNINAVQGGTNDSNFIMMGGYQDENTGGANRRDC